MVERPFRVLSLCSGGGGLDLGLRMAVPNARTVCYVEIEAFAAACLEAKMSEGWLDEAPIWSDLSTFDGKSWRGAVDCVMGGYPCQPFSVAGQRSGVDHAEHLWPHVRRIVEETEPTWCFFENVSGHITLGLDTVFADLQGLDYDTEVGIFAAEEVGATHKRERIFILANGGGGKFSRSQPGRSERIPRGSGAILADTSGERRQGEMGDGYSDGLQGSSDDGATRRPFPAAWPPSPDDRERWAEILRERPELAPATQSAIRRMADGMADGLGVSREDELRLIGNGVVPDQAAFAFTHLIERFGE